ncbi:50S ribosomal protein L25 [Candidatus Parcubacteria bacterium]|nr:50S ribosomal protein L25 [Candidatus Parcubacteria bacterium]
MEVLTISAQTRKLTGRKTNKLRKESCIPGIVYGPKSKDTPLKVNKKDFKDVFSKAGESTLIDLRIDDKEIGKVIINNYQVDPVSDDIIHFDLYQVRMDKKMTTKVSVKFIGESPAVKNENGILVKNHDTLEVKCLPKDLIHNIEIDLSVLEHIDNIIRVKDLKISDNIEIMADLEETIVNVAPPRTEKEMEELDEKVEASVEGVESAKEKKGEDESSEEEGEKKEEAKEGNKKEEKKDKK